MLSMRKTVIRSPAYADDLDAIVYDDGRPIGRISEDRQHWFWTLTVFGARHAGIATTGQASSLEQAKAELQANFKKWLVWSKLEEAES